MEEQNNNEQLKEFATQCAMNGTDIEKTVESIMYFIKPISELAYKNYNYLKSIIK